MTNAMQNIINKFNNKKQLDFVFFWKPQKMNTPLTSACLCQWHSCSFHVDNVTYSNCEQFMMAQKALLFEDIEVYNKVLKTSKPKDCKELGRQVKNFNSSTWDKEKYSIVVRGNMAKFSQNEDLKTFLLSTEDKILVESSPYDRVWGVGLKEDNKDIKNPYNWRGQNLLGFALMEVRDNLKINNTRVCF